MNCPICRKPVTEQFLSARVTIGGVKGMLAHLHCVDEFHNVPVDDSPYEIDCHAVAAARRDTNPNYR